MADALSSRVNKAVETKAQAKLIEVRAAIESEVGDLVEVRRPEDCEPPVLSHGVRGAVHEWMVEAQSRRELEGVGLKPRQTCLLEGPPGCGKTTLAHHFAARLGYLLVVAKGEMIVGGHLGESARNVGRFFTGIKKHNKHVVGFLDEIDALGTTRTQDNQACGREQNAVVTSLLTNIESFNGLFFAATNLAGSLDPALWRRFGMQIRIDLPDTEERYAILQRYAEPFLFHDAFIDTLVGLTSGAAPSLLRQLMEGIKRSLILGPKLRRETDNAVAVVASVAAQVAPHPSYMQPPFLVPALWGNPDSVDLLGGKPWPPARMARKESVQ